MAASAMTSEAASSVFTSVSAESAGLADSAVLSSSEASFASSEETISYSNKKGSCAASMETLREILQTPTDCTVITPSSSIAMISGLSLLHSDRTGESGPCSTRAVSLWDSPTFTVYFSASDSSPDSCRDTSFSSLTKITIGVCSGTSEIVSVSAARACEG